MVSWFLSHLGLQNLAEGEFFIKIIGLLGAAVAFTIALLQYRRADLWRRSEFVANEMKRFFENQQVRNALLMIDWGARRINIELTEKIKLEDCPRIDRALQISALMPHTVTLEWAVPQDSIQNLDERLVKTRLGSYTLVETLIRDTYDALLDSFDRFEHFVEAGVVAAGELEPYLRYWIKDITRTDLRGLEAAWQLSLLTYIAFYEFSGVQELFQGFGHDIRPSGPLWTKLADEVEDRHLVELLARSISDQLSLPR